MRINKKPPLPPQMPPTEINQESAGPVGSRQAAMMERIKRLRDAQAQRGRSGLKKDKKGHLEETVISDFDEVMLSTFDRVLGKKRRPQDERDKEDESVAEDHGLDDAETEAAKLRLRIQAVRRRS